MEDENTMAMDKPTFIERWRRKILPSKHCFMPENISDEFLDCLHVEVTCVLSVIDRVKLLFTGTLCVRSVTATQFVIGKNITNSVCYVTSRSRQI